MVSTFHSDRKAGKKKGHGSTPAQLAANRRNGRKSTGPKSAAGKAKSSQNAKTHGLCARSSPLMPDEDPAPYRQRIHEWAGDLRPKGPVQTYLVTQAVNASWTLDRSYGLEVDLARAAATRPIAEDEALEMLDDKATRDELLAYPAATLAQLQSSVAGVVWLRTVWTHLLGELNRRKCLYLVEEVRLAIALTGHRPELTHLRTDPAARLFLGNELERSHGWCRVRVYTEDWAWLLSLYEEEADPALIREVEAQLVAEAARGGDAAEAWQRQFLEDQLAHLDELLEQLQAQARAPGASPTGALNPLSEPASGSLLLRYRSQAERALYKALSELSARQETEGRADPAEEVADPDPETTWACGDEAILRNEANSATRSEGVESSDTESEGEAGRRGVWGPSDRPDVGVPWRVIAPAATPEGDPSPPSA